MIYTATELKRIEALERRIAEVESCYTLAATRYKNSLGTDQEAHEEMKQRSPELLDLLKEYNAALDRKTSPIKHS